MARYLLSEPAVADLRAVREYLRARSPQAADQVMLSLRTAMRRLAEFPRIGHLREDLTDQPLRFWAVYSYLIAYLPDTKPLQIIRIIHGARGDIPSELHRR
jgi:toxin ParE1/3/4